MTIATHRAPRYIETLPRRGYRFIMAVEEASQATVQAEPHAGTGAPPVSISSPTGHTAIRRNLRFRVWSLVLLGALAMGVHVVARPPSQHKQRKAGDDRRPPSSGFECSRHRRLSKLGFD